jgi:hypothetical protein
LPASAQVAVAVNTNTRLDFKLPIASRQETITLEAAARPLRPESAGPIPPGVLPPAMRPTDAGHGGDLPALNTPTVNPVTHTPSPGNQF